MVCMAEGSKHLVREARVLLPTRPGQAMREGYAYERKGIVNVFLFGAPLTSKRWM